ncbi:hypothetical protein J1N35_011979, partial [Gossypium stocksii]
RSKARKLREQMNDTLGESIGLAAGSSPHSDSKKLAKDEERNGKIVIQRKYK